MKKIKLTKGKFALVDNNDYPFLIKFKWQAVKKNSTWYAYRGQQIDNKYCKIYMHRQLLACDKNQFGDHKNGNGLDNRHCNLRTATKQENQRNRNKTQANKSGYKGVIIINNRYRAVIKNKKQIHLGYFDTPEQAAVAYNRAAKKLFGKFARLNTLYKKC